jgi:hypothetical protein
MRAVLYNLVIMGNGQQTPRKTEYHGESVTMSSTFDVRVRLEAGHLNIAAIDIDSGKLYTSVYDPVKIGDANPILRGGPLLEILVDHYSPIITRDVDATADSVNLAWYYPMEAHGPWAHRDRFEYIITFPVAREVTTESDELRAANDQIRALKAREERRLRRKRERIEYPEYTPDLSGQFDASIWDSPAPSDTADTTSAPTPTPADAGLP